MQPIAIHRTIGPALQTLVTPTPQQPPNISAVQHDWRFAFVGNETPEERAELERMLAAVIEFAADMLSGGQPRWLTLCGKSGTGKTYLAKALSTFIGPRLNGLYNRDGRPKVDPRKENPDTLYCYAQNGPRFIKWPQIIDDMRDGDFSGWSSASRDWFKIIDEIGGETKERDRDWIERPTMFAIGKLSRLCDDRLGKWTIFTTNYYRSQIANLYDARIASRMMRDGNRIVELPEYVRDFNLRREKATVSPASA